MDKLEQYRQTSVKKFWAELTEQYKDQPAEAVFDALLKVIGDGPMEIVFLHNNFELKHTTTGAPTINEKPQNAGLIDGTVRLAGEIQSPLPPIIDPKITVHKNDGENLIIFPGEFKFAEPALITLDTFKELYPDQDIIPKDIMKPENFFIMPLVSIRLNDDPYNPKLEVDRGGRLIIFPISDLAQYEKALGLQPIS